LRGTVVSIVFPATLIGERAAKFEPVVARQNPCFRMLFDVRLAEGG
jgi:hypothetical protein